MGNFSLTVLLSVAVCAGATNPAAERLAKEAREAENKGHVVEAYLLWAKAAAADPKNPAYWTKASSLRTPATILSDRRLPVMGSSFPEPPPPDPDVVGSLTRQQLLDIERMQEPPRLKPFEGSKAFHLRGDAKSLFEQVAATFGYAVIFDKDYQPQSSIRFDMEDADYKGVLHGLETATNSFIVPLSDKVMLVAQDTVQKRQDLEPNEAVGIPIPQRTSAQEAQELMMMVQQGLEIRRASLDPVKRLVYMRDRASKIELAKALFLELSGGKPQVEMEIEFLSVGKNTSLGFGLTLPTQFPIISFGDTGILKRSAIPAGFMKFLTIGGGASFLGIGLTDAALFATATRTEAASILKSQLTASDGQPATLHIGDKYPIQTGAYIGSGGLTAGGTTYSVISTASYADQTSIAVSLNGSMEIVVNGKKVPFTLTTASNSLLGLSNVINSLGLGIGAQVIQRGTQDRQLSLLVVGTTLGITSIQLFDDPSGQNIQLLKPPDFQSSISKNTFATVDQTQVSNTLSLDLIVGDARTPIVLNDATNNLLGLRDAINKASAGVTASILSTGSQASPFYMQLVATAANGGKIQVEDDPTGAKTDLFSPTDEISASSSFGNRVNGSSFGQTYTPPPTFNFEDLGLVIKVTPFVHDIDEVTLDVEAEFKVLGSGSFNGVPVISTRKYHGKVRLRTSEYAVVAGLVTDSEARSIRGLAGLSNIPYLGALLRDNNTSHDRSEILLVIKPRVTSFPASEFTTKTYWFGSEMKPSTIL